MWEIKGLLVQLKDHTCDGVFFEQNTLNNPFPKLKFGI